MSKGKGSRLPLDPALLPFAPMLYIAWADGALTSDEIEQVREVVRRDRSISKATRTRLDAWLDADARPTPEELSALLASIHRAGDALQPADRSSLARLGISLAREAADDGVTQDALSRIESALGVAGGEAARSLFGAAQSAPAAAKADSFDPALLYQFLDSDHSELRRSVLELLSTPEFERPVAPSIAEHRDIVFRWVRRLADEGYGGLAFPTEFGGDDDGTKTIAVFETLAFHDLSLLVKFGVHFGLCGGSVFLLGTRRHHERYLRDIATLKLPGCFAMTETGHGSNVRDLQTTAVYDPETHEFIIHTPSDNARKDYIGNAALHAQLAVVFAQLIVGGASHGVHAVLVPLRDSTGKTRPGIRIEDCGPKEGLNGVDNGRIWFNAVRVPRENLLNRFADVSESGTYTSPITSPTRRFFTMLGTLVAGRVSIAGASVNAAKSALTIAIRYTDQRRQFGAEGAPEQSVLDYLAVQRRLLPALAQTVALDCAMKDLIRRFGTRTEETAREIEALAAAMKALTSQHALHTIQQSRQACGGAGYMSENGFAALYADTDVFTTFEGANDVLLQLVARGMLTEYREQFGDMNVWSALRYVTKRAAATLGDLNPVAPRRTDEEHLLDPGFHSDAFRYREQRLLQSLARRLRQRISDGQDSFDAMNDCQDHALAAARAWGERYVLECLHDAVKTVHDPRLRPILDRLAALYALERVEADSAWFLETGFLEAAKSRAVRHQVNKLCRQIRPDAVAIVAGFGIPDALVSAPVAGSAT